MSQAYQGNVEVRKVYCHYVESEKVYYIATEEVLSLNNLYPYIIPQRKKSLSLAVSWSTALLPVALTTIVSRLLLSDVGL